MPVKIRLARRGRKKNPYYHIIVADARAPRDGKFIERIGSYNPMTKPATIELDRDKAFDWLMKGAQPTETARAILRFKGVLYKKHLQRGVSKGALTQEDADRLFQEHIDSKESMIADRVEKAKQDKLDFLKKVSGSVKKAYVEEAPATEALKDFQEGDEAESAEEVVAEAASEAEEVVAEATSEAEEVVAEATSEAEEVVAEATEEVVAEIEETATEASGSSEEE